MIKVNKKQLEFKEDMTVYDALKLADQGIDSMIIVMVNGKAVSNTDLKITKINDNTEISLFRLVSGG